MKTITKMGSIAALLLGLASPLYPSMIPERSANGNPITKLFIEDATNYMSGKSQNQLDPYQIEKYYKAITIRMAELVKDNSLEEQTWKEFNHMLNMLANLDYVHSATDGGPISFRMPGSAEEYRIKSTTFERLENMPITPNAPTTNSTSTNKRVQDFMRTLTAQLTNNNHNTNTPNVYQEVFNRKSTTNIVINLPPIILANDSEVTQEVDLSRYMERATEELKNREMTTERLKSITDLIIETPPLDSINGQTIKSNLEGELRDIKENIIEPIKDESVRRLEGIVMNSEYFTNSITRQQMSIEERLDAIDGITGRKDMYTEKKIKELLCHLTALMLLKPEEVKGYTGRIMAYMGEIEEQYTKYKIPDAAKDGMDKARVYLVPLLKLVKHNLKRIEQGYKDIN